MNETLEAMNKAQVKRMLKIYILVTLIYFRLILPSLRLTLELACLMLSVEHPSQKWQKHWKTC